MQQHCPPGTGYDAVSHACEWLSECGKPKTTTSTTTAAPAPVNVGGYGAPPATTPSTECAQRADGFYERGSCQSAYLFCSNGHAHIQACPAQLVFRNDSCVYLNECLK